MNSHSRPRIALIHPNLDSGGAESQIKQLLQHLKEVFDVHVIFIGHTSDRTYEFCQNSRELNYYFLSERVEKFRRVRVGIKVLQTIRELSPKAIVSFLAHTNLLSLFCGRLTKSTKIIWGLRTSDFQPREFGLKGDLVIGASNFLAQQADALISNNRAGLHQLSLRAHLPKRTFVIQNGIDSKKFSPNSIARRQYRKDLGLDGSITIASVARIVPWKGYERLLRVAKRLAAQPISLRFLFIGSGNFAYETYLREFAAELGISDSVTWLGDRDDIAQLSNAFDIFALCSESGEGFSNALAEAMLMEKAVITTDVGDSSEIVGDTGIVIEPGDEFGLENALSELISSPERRTELGKRARARIRQSFDVSSCNTRFASAIEQVLGSKSLSAETR